MTIHTRNSKLFFTGAEKLPDETNGPNVYDGKGGTSVTKSSKHLRYCSSVAAAVLSCASGILERFYLCTSMKGEEPHDVEVDELLKTIPLEELEVLAPNLKVFSDSRDIPSMRIISILEPVRRAILKMPIGLFGLNQHIVRWGSSFFKNMILEERENATIDFPSTGWQLWRPNPELQVDDNVEPDSPWGALLGRHPSAKYLASLWGLVWPEFANAKYDSVWKKNGAGHASVYMAIQCLCPSGYPIQTNVTGDFESGVRHPGSPIAIIENTFKNPKNASRGLLNISKRLDFYKLSAMECALAEFDTTYAVGTINPGAPYKYISRIAHNMIGSSSYGVMPRIVYKDDNEAVIYFNGIQGGGESSEENVPNSISWKETSSSSVEDIDAHLGSSSFPVKIIHGSSSSTSIDASVSGAVYITFDMLDSFGDFLDGTTMWTIYVYFEKGKITLFFPKALTQQVREFAVDDSILFPTITCEVARYADATLTIQNPDSTSHAESHYPCSAGWRISRPEVRLHVFKKLFALYGHTMPISRIGFDNPEEYYDYKNAGEGTRDSYNDVFAYKSVDTNVYTSESGMMRRWNSEAEELSNKVMNTGSDLSNPLADIPIPGSALDKLKAIVMSENGLSAHVGYEPETPYLSAYRSDDGTIFVGYGDEEPHPFREGERLLVGRLGISHSSSPEVSEEDIKELEPMMAFGEMASGVKVEWDCANLGPTRDD